MATIDRALGGIALRNMNYHQSEPFIQKNSTSGSVESPFHGTSSSQLGQINSIPVAGGLNNNNSCFSTYSSIHTNPVSGPESMAMFLGNGAPMPNPGKIKVICSGLTGRMTKKHKHDDEEYDCPSKKRKVSLSPVFEECQGRGAIPPCWNSSQSQLAPPVIQPLNAQSSEMQPNLAEDMEEAPVEAHYVSALRRIRDIESRLDIEDEDEGEEEDSSTGHLPTLVMSDVLVQSLRQGLDESLTRKIVDSISRPSMELVLWRPQPEFIDKLQSSKDDSGASKKGQSTLSNIPLLQNIDLLGGGRPQTVTLDCNTEPIWSKEEEEMEL